MFSLSPGSYHSTEDLGSEIFVPFCLPPRSDSEVVYELNKTETTEAETKSHDSSSLSCNSQSIKTFIVLSDFG